MSCPSDALPAKVEARIPGEEGIWILICGDLMVFSLFFCVFLYYRAQQLGLFIASQAHLDQTFGFINTMFMLTSSWFVALAVRAARMSLGRATPALFALAMFCGIGFVVVKVLEYGEKIRAGITLITNDFYMYYFVLTGIHLLHVLIGMGVLVALVLYTKNGEYTPTKIKHLETGATFWHLVDLLWIVLFALLYLLR